MEVRQQTALLQLPGNLDSPWHAVGRVRTDNETLWADVRSAISAFLFKERKGGALPGAKPEEAFFVRCERTIMTQNDLDNGRLICLIGVALVKPAEFVIFRIGQGTADRKP